MRLFDKSEISHILGAPLMITSLTLGARTIHTFINLN